MHTWRTHTHTLRCPNRKLESQGFQTAATCNRQSASEIATKIASKSVEKKEEIASEMAVIQSAAISNRYRVGFEIAGDLGI